MKSRINYNEILFQNVVDGMPVRKIAIGSLALPTGQIVVCDPLAYPDRPPFVRAVAPGYYPVTLYMADTGASGERVAIATLQFNSTQADYYELALRPNEDDSELASPDEFYGFPVDAGLGGFIDVAVLTYYNQFLDNFYTAHPNGNIYDDFFKDIFKLTATEERPDGDWVNFQFPEKPDYNLSMFSSGYGDGVYPAYWGLTKKGECVNLIIDFHVLLLPEG